jgi:HSP20 family protein
MYRSLFSRDLFADFDRLQREMAQALDPLNSTIRGIARGSFPALNVGQTPQAVEIYAFVPGIDPKTLEVQVDRGVLSIAGERRLAPPEGGNKATVHIDERFSGPFRRVISLPDDADPNGVTAQCRDGVLHVTVRRLESAQPRRIAIQ